MTEQEKRKIKHDFAKQANIEPGILQDKVIPDGYRTYPCPEINAILILPKGLSDAELEIRKQTYLLNLRDSRNRVDNTELIKQ